ncbi:MAG: ATP-dependent DNA helicase RecG [Candidatus Eiseniibacteriota bacterium]
MSTPELVTRRTALKLTPTTQVQFLPGVGPRRAAALARLGIATLEDLLRHVPRDYLDARRTMPIARLVPRELVTVVGKVTYARVRQARGRSDLVTRVEDPSGALGVRWFGQGFLARTIREGDTLALIGRLVPGPGREFANPLFEVLEGDVTELLNAGRIVPRHPLTAGIAGRLLRGWMRAALDAIGPALAREDPLPAALRARLALPALNAALEFVHFPPDPKAAETGRRRLAFEELLVVQLVLAIRRRARAESGRALVTARGMARARAVIAALPFTPTAAQKRAVNEIVRDMKRDRSMHRLLVGDVGSGKTVVALIAAACAVEAGHQVALMAPTEILAEQHFRTLTALGRAAGLVPALWTGSTGEVARKEMRRRLRLPAGDRFALDLVVGTHALLEEDVPLPRLGLVIVDEQHRFGVRQRAVLATRGPGFPDVLVMTATPIPRTLALACFGDLDVSVLDERPPGRKPVVTRVVPESNRESLERFLASELEAGRQAYVVVPLIEESEKSELRAARATIERVRSHPALAAYRWELLHGRLKPAEKEAVMRGFASGAIQGLVSTTVIEVGVDVPNASVMVVEHAERFGLTQLHQLRGRVGRGSARSVCVLVPGSRVTPEAAERLSILARTEDGFELAEEDLRARGPGELWGARQTGLPALKVADLVRDRDLLETASQIARELVERDPQLEEPGHRGLRERLLRNFGEELSWRATG